MRPRPLLSLLLCAAAAACLTAPMAEAKVLTGEQARKAALRAMTHPTKNVKRRGPDRWERAKVAPCRLKRQGRSGPSRRYRFRKHSCLATGWRTQRCPVYDPKKPRGYTMEPLCGWVETALVVIQSRSARRRPKITIFDFDHRDFAGGFWDLRPGSPTYYTVEEAEEVARSYQRKRWGYSAH